jgi:exonuclease SbcD
MRPFRILLVGDTHLGLDLPERPRIERRRRGDDFFDNFERALEPARRGEVDVVVHAGDVLYRSQVSPSLVRRAFAPMLALAETGLPVLVVPGNHERSAIPYPLLVAHRHLHVFDRPRTFLVDSPRGRVAFCGFPYAHEVRTRFPELVEATGWRTADAPRRILCVHQAFEGGRVGPNDFTFTNAPDVVRGGDIPHGLDAVLSGHLHRAQILRSDLAGHPLAAPVVHAGSTERTSFAEREETKGYMLIAVPPPPARLAWKFVPLPTRPMVELELDGAAASSDAEIRRQLGLLPPDAIVRVRVAEGARELDVATLRRLAPPTMEVRVRAGAAG